MDFLDNLPDLADDLDNHGVKKVVLSKLGFNKRKSFLQLKKLIESGKKEVVLKNDFNRDLYDDYNNCPKFIEINGDLVIDGKEHSIDGNRFRSVFNVVKGNVVFKNITFKNFETAIKISNKDSSCEIINCHFQENFSSSESSLVNEGVLKIKNSFFTNGKNSIILNQNDLEIIDTEFKSSSSRIDNRGKLKIIDSSFSQFNTSKILINYADMCLKDTRFDNNVSDNSIIYNGIEGELNIDKTTFKRNSVGESVIFNEGLCDIKVARFENTEIKYSWKSENSPDIFNKSKLILGDIEIINDNKTIYNEGKILCDELKDEIKDKIVNRGSISGNSNDFRDLNLLINESDENEIILESDYTIEKGELSLFKSGITLEKSNLIIDGNNHIIDAGGLSAIFMLNGENIRLKNIIFKNGFSKGDSAIINNNSSTSFHDCKFENAKGTLISNNSSTNFYACEFESSCGTVLKNNGDSSFHDCTFEKSKGRTIENNKSIKLSDCHIYESDFSIHNNEGEVTIDNTDFIKNESNIIENISGKVFINDADFEANSNSIENENGFIKLDKTNFNNQEIGIKNTEANLELFNVKINKNESSEPVIHNVGGNLKADAFDLKSSNSAILNENEGKISLRNSSFNNGKEILKNMSGEINLTDVTIKDNGAGTDFDAISNYYGHMNIVDCKFFDNIDYQNIILNKSELFISNSIFKNNSSSQIIKNEDKEEGILNIEGGQFSENGVTFSAIFNEGKKGSLSKAVFENNKSLEDGFSNILNYSDLIFKKPIFKDDGISIFNFGKINTKQESKSKYEKHIHNEGIVEDEVPPKERRCDFSHLDSLIHNDEGNKEIFLEKDILFGIYETDYYEGGINLDIDDLTIDGNGKTIYGNGKSRIFIISGENITIKNVNFKQGISYKTLYDLIDGGGLIKINSRSTVNFEKCTFEYGFSEEEGGAIHNKIGSTCIIDNCKFNGNSAKENGGAIVNEGIMELIDSNFNENSTENLGGAISNYGDIDLRIVSFESNGKNVKKNKEDSVLLSGVIYNGGILKSFKSDFMSNDGVVIANSQSGEMILNESTFNDHKGTLIKNDDSANATINECILKNNRLSKEYYSEGLISNSGKMNLNHSKIFENESQRAIISNFDKGEIEISYSEFERNGLESSGSVINNEKYSKISINNSKLNNNLIRCIYNYGELSLNSSTFNDNKKGVIFNTYDLRVNNCIFENNSGDYGAAIGSRRGRTKIVNSKFKNNHANNGGAIYNTEGGAMHSGIGLRSCSEGIILIEKSYFENNSANLKGGAIYNDEDGVLIVENCDFQINSAEAGGAIFSIHADFNYYKNRLEVSNCTYFNNRPNNIYTDAVTLNRPRF